MALPLHLAPVPVPHRPSSRAAGLRLVESPPVRTSAARPNYALRRAVALVVVALCLLGAASAVRSVGSLFVQEPAAQMAGDGSGSVVVRTVQPGETLWSIAATASPGRDPRPAVDELVRLNGGSTLEAGAQVVIPASWAHAR